jgi:class 3 adenylate cyclase
MRDDGDDETTGEQAPEPEGHEEPPEPAGKEAKGAKLKRLRERAARLDSDPAVVDAVEALRRRLPGDTRFGDGISTSGDKPAALAGREVSALAPDRPSAINQLGLGALQVWQSLSDSAKQRRGDQPLALVFTDLVGFSSWALEAGDKASVTLLRDAGQAIETAMVDREGRVVKRLGDGIMAVFEHPSDAAEGVMLAFDELATVEVDGYTPSMRAGIHFGQPRKVGDDYLGVDVNIAARVGETARANQLLMSESAADMLQPAAWRLGRPKRLRAQGAPKGLRVREVSRLR